MKLRFVDRLLTALAGLLLFAAGLVFFLWAVRGIPAAWLDALAGKEVSRVLFFSALGLGTVMALLGLHNISLLFRRRGKKGFVVQKTEHGELSISIHAMENLVQKCVDKHEELTVVSNRIENNRDGVVVDLRIGLANGVSIPLVVSSLQKQIKQYITSCSGIDVQEVKVEVETASIKAEKSLYSVPDSLLQNVPKASPVETPPPVKAPPPPISVVQPPVNSMPPPVSAVQPPAPQVMQRITPDLKGPSFPAAPIENNDANEEKKRPLHQRLFGHREQPAIVPMPPEMERKTELRDDAQMLDLQEDADSAHEARKAQEGEDHEEH